MLRKSSLMSSSNITTDYEVPSIIMINDETFDNINDSQFDVLVNTWWKLMIWSLILVGCVLFLAFFSRCCYCAWDCCTDPYWGCFPRYESCGNFLRRPRRKYHETTINPAYPETSLELEPQLYHNDYFSCFDFCRCFSGTAVYEMSTVAAQNYEFSTDFLIPSNDETKPGTPPVMVTCSNLTSSSKEEPREKIIYSELVHSGDNQNSKRWKSANINLSRSVDLSNSYNIIQNHILQANEKNADELIHQASNLEKTIFFGQETRI